MLHVANEVATCNTSPARLLGFLGATCSWFLGASGVADALLRNSHARYGLARNY